MSVTDIVYLVAGAAIPTFIFSWLATFGIRRLAPRWGLVDRPGGERKQHQRVTPLGGGLAIWFSVVLFFGLFHFILVGASVTEEVHPLKTLVQALPFSGLLSEHKAGLQSKLPDVWFILGSATALMLLGLADDRFRLGWKIRLSIQFFVAAFGVYLFDHWRLTVFLDSPLLTAGLSVFWIVGLLNAFNMLDNMDGLASGVAVISAIMLAAALLLSPETGGNDPQLFVAGFLLVLAGSVLGFLWHNHPPARIFMGDAGSYFVGFCIAVATILATFSSQGSESRHSILVPLCVMAVPFYDMLTVIWIRFREGRSPFDADRCHFSHRLVDLGFSQSLAVYTIYLLTIICGIAAMLLQQVEGFSAMMVILLVLSVLLLIGILETTARKKTHSSHDTAKTK